MACTQSQSWAPSRRQLISIAEQCHAKELDKGLIRRGLRYVRYVDDCVIAVGSKSECPRVMHTITNWIAHNLGLKVNVTKVHVCRPTNLKYLGFGFYKDSRSKRWAACPHKTSFEKFRRKLKALTDHSRSISMDERISQLNSVTRGWINYFSIGRMKTSLEKIDAHLRTRMRSLSGSNGRHRANVPRVCENSGCREN